MTDMRMLFFGAGVLGSVYAARLHEAGVDVTLLARGRRLADIREHGVVLEVFGSGKRTTTRVEVVDRMPRDEHFDVCVVPIQATQVEAALPTLAENPHIPSFVFMHNTVTGFDPLVQALGRERVLIGHANLGGERDGHVVHYMASQNMTFGELDGGESVRLQRIADAFRAAGFGVEFNADMDAWKRYHMAFGAPMTNAMYMAGSCNYRLARNREALGTFIRGMREGFEVLKAHGFTIEPKKMRQLAALPDFALVLLFRVVMRMRIMDIGGARHARNAREEMAQLSRQLLSLAEQADVPTPTLRDLHRYALEPATPG
jgi:2-dehydropantoate 2-reductase